MCSEWRRKKERKLFFDKKNPFWRVFKKGWENLSVKTVINIHSKKA
jgi:hypothetical protein